jgi:hypothetical protein
MDEQKQSALGFIDESYKGNLRIRLYRVPIIGGSLTCLVELAAWNSWAGQAKILHVWGGLELDAANDIVAFFKEHVRGYDWHDHEVLLEEK